MGYLEQQGYFDSTLVFKGGTALRKFLFGADGRFSVDIALALAGECNEDFVQVVLEMISTACASAGLRSIWSDAAALMPRW